MIVWSESVSARRRSQMIAQIEENKKKIAAVQEREAKYKTLFINERDGRRVLKDQHAIVVTEAENLKRERDADRLEKERVCRNWYSL